MMDSNSTQVSIFYIYSSRKASEREGNVYFTGTQSHAIQFTHRKSVQLKKRNYKFVEQKSYLGIKLFTNMYEMILPTKVQRKLKSDIMLGPDIISWFPMDQRSDQIIKLLDKNLTFICFIPFLQERINLAQSLNS